MNIKNYPNLKPWKPGQSRNPESGPGPDCALLARKSLIGASSCTLIPVDPAHSLAFALSPVQIASQRLAQSKNPITGMGFLLWRARPDLNRRSPPWQGGVITTSLRALASVEHKFQLTTGVSIASKLVKSNCKRRLSHEFSASYYEKAKQPLRGDVQADFLLIFEGLYVLTDVFE